MTGPAAVPDGDDAPSCRGRDCGRDGCSSCDAIRAWYARMDGDDVPARLRRVADALRAEQMPYCAQQVANVADTLRDVPESMRAAVAAALAGPAPEPEQQFTAGPAKLFFAPDPELERQVDETLMWWAARRELARPLTPGSVVARLDLLVTALREYRAARPAFERAPAPLPPAAQAVVDAAVAWRRTWLERHEHSGAINALHETVVAYERVQDGQAPARDEVRTEWGVWAHGQRQPATWWDHEPNYATRTWWSAEDRDVEYRTREVRYGPWRRAEVSVRDEQGGGA